jgi:hypothetical protein
VNKKGRGDKAVERESDSLSERESVGMIVIMQLIVLANTCGVYMLSDNQESVPAAIHPHS